jgi:prepilin-type N-terminal cleavage/methylation domain-containing protein
MKGTGFTLVEVLVAIFLVGLAVTALLVTNKALTQSNSAGLEISTAEFLIEQIKELTALLPVDDLDDFASASPFSPPINANSQPLTNFSAYRQQVTVQKVYASNFSLPVLDGSDSPVVRVTVKVYLNSKLIGEQSWIRTRY